MVVRADRVAALAAAQAAALAVTCCASMLAVTCCAAAAALRRRAPGWADPLLLPVAVAAVAPSVALRLPLVELMDDGSSVPLRGVTMSGA